MTLSNAPRRPALGCFASCALALAAAILGVPAAAAADEIVIFDAGSDFAPTYVGERNDDLDISIAAAFVEGNLLHLATVQDNFIGISEAPQYVWAIDRGSGIEGLLNGAPSLGAGIRFDALVVVTAFFGELPGADGGFAQQATAYLTTFGPGGPVTTDITAGAAAISSDVSIRVPLALLPSMGFDLADYQVNLWTRDGLGNDHIADFALDNGMFGINLEPGAVPEPTTWALMIGGFALAGAALRRRLAVARV